MRGTPQTMQGLTDYKNVIEEIIEFLQTKKASCLEKGIRDIIIDPGFGFAKTIEQNLKMIKHFEEFQQLKCPLLMGISRKSFIYKSLNSTLPTYIK
jgi:dihydropteroate synthase